ncbi:DUF2332 domain-containing protein [Microbacterium lushaniae]|uniref:DUF2332 domain-containing protein n=1 Tax=Microbacterium lushaniae TaxID=2614639 RepID=A0A5J6L5L0_9MICO|nr:DUF2332 domain-containing protein [Microbacterium lushaniae]QEW03823.1 DUF2332 domain-containing protein [Microbacterium lushaniae]
MGTPESDAVIARYARFARDEAPGRSTLYAEWAAGVAADPATARILTRIPETHRQPPLVFAVTRMLGAPEAGFPRWAAWLRAHADEVVAECAARLIQTNEPLRCAALLPALSLIEGPIALLELGASAGLCLYPDRYSYRYDTGADLRRIDPATGRAPVVLRSRLTGDPALRMPDVVWRAGIDLEPLDARDPRDRAWLTGLVWPGEEGRRERVEAALAVAAADPPLLIAGDAADALAAVAARAPREATLVVTTPGVLAHIPRARRSAVIEAARAAGRWITIDEPGLHEGWSAVPSTWPGGFALALDGDILAAVDPLGASVEWLPGGGRDRP